MVCEGCGAVCACSGRELHIIYLPINQNKIGLDTILRGEMWLGGVCFIDCACDVDLPLRCYDERILVPDDLTLGNRHLRDESFPRFPIEIFVFDGCCPFGDVKTFDERGRWVNVSRLGPSSRRG